MQKWPNTENWYQRLGVTIKIPENQKQLWVWAVSRDWQSLEGSAEDRKMKAWNFIRDLLSGQNQNVIGIWAVKARSQME